MNNTSRDSIEFELRAYLNAYYTDKLSGFYGKNSLTYKLYFSYVYWRCQLVDDVHRHQCQDNQFAQLLVILYNKLYNMVVVAIGFRSGK